MQATNESKCLCCGRSIPAEVIRYKAANEEERSVRRIVCTACGSSKPSGRQVTIPESCMEGCMVLAGKIVLPCLSRYRALYLKAVAAVLNVHTLVHGDVDAFLEYHRMLRGEYFQVLSMGMISDLMDCERRQAEKGMDETGRKAAAKIREVLA